MSRRRVIPLGLNALLLFASAACAEVAVRLVPETTSLFIHEPFSLRLEIECDAPPETPKLPDVPGLAVITVRRLPSEPARRRHAFQIGLLAEREGILAVPPFAVRVGEEQTLTSALRLRIRSPRPATEMELSVTVEPTALRVGQPATVSVIWSSTVPWERCQQLLLEIPLLSDARCQLFPLEPPLPEAEQIGLPVNNMRVVAQPGVLADQRRFLSFAYTLVPREPCLLRSQPAQLTCALVDGEHARDQQPSYFYNRFFSAPGDNEAYERIQLTAPVPEIIVRTIPEADRNDHFAGILGPCDLRATVSPARLVVGQPALLTVHLDGLAFARHIDGLPSAAFDGLRPEFQLSAEPIRESATDHSRSFTQIVRPLRSGITRIPAVVIQTFDPDSGEYQTLRSESLPITVEPDPEGVLLAAAPRTNARPPTPIHGIRHNRIDEQPLIFLRDLLEFFGRHWWVFVPLPPLVWLALLPLVRRRERCRRDPVYARAQAALWRFRRTAWRDEESAWRNYLADRLALCAEALTADSVIAALHARKVDGDLIAETRRRLEERDAVEYGKHPAASSPSTRGLVRRLHRATVPLWLVLCGLWGPLPGNAAETPDELFATAARIRGEQPDQAQPLFVEAALQFESARRYGNAGNSWFFAGENGRALANFRFAERCWPLDRQVRESIEFLRASRADAFPAPTAVPGRMASWWARFGTWAPVLRVGLLVLAYLAAWMLFLAAQLSGWRVRRTVYAVLFVAVLVPLVSVAQTRFQPAEGVVIEDTVARLGPGYGYDPAFEHSLHKAAEFSWLETRGGWVRARLPDGSEGWLRESDCLRVE